MFSYQKSATMLTHCRTGMKLLKRRMKNEQNACVFLKFLFMKESRKKRKISNLI